MNPQTKPSLESIFGTPQQAGGMGTSARPSLDSILGVNKPDLPPASTKEKVLATTGGLAEGLGGTMGLGVIDWAGRKLIEKLPEDTTFAGLTKAQMLENLDKSPSLQKQFESRFAKDKAPELYDNAEIVGMVAGLAPLPVAGARYLAGTKPVRAVRDLSVGLLSGSLRGAKNLYKGVDTETFANTLASPEVAPFIAKSPENIKVVEQAFKQGFEDKDIKFMSTINDADKADIKQMKELAEKASTDRRAEVGKRPMDIVGENGVATIKQVQKLNEEAGALVDKTARDLAGSNVDATAVQATAISAMERMGIVLDEAGQLNFDASIFKKFPALQKKIKNALSDLPTGQVDAYDLHKFKKSLDEFKNYESSGGKGLTTSLEGLIGEIRASTDNVLDTTFDAYNKANTDYKKTADFMKEAYSFVGKNTDFLTKQGAEDFGQAMRSLFSNNKSRGKVGTFLQNLQNIADEYGVASEKNLVDQSIFAQILESTYGTQAITGIQGEMTKALRKGLDFADRPVGATGDFLIEKLGKMRDVTPEQRKKVIDLFLQD